MRIRILVAVIILVAAPGLAWPCMNPIYLSGDAAVKRVKAAEKLLEREQYKEAARKVNPNEFEFEDAALKRRAVLVYATANLRRGHNMIGYLRMLHDEDSGDPVVQARYAEALLRVGGDELADQGRDLIEDLSARDLVPDAYGWATLAKARDRAKDEAGRDDALARCRTIAKKKSICRVR